MNRHFEDGELLAAVLSTDDESGVAATHLRDCADCRARHAHVREALRDSLPAPVAQPDTFWRRQQLQIERRVSREGRGAMHPGRVLSVAAAAILAFVLSAVGIYRSFQQPAPAATTQTASIATVQNTSTATAATHEELLQSSQDPWASDELKGYHSVVEWESWVDTKNKGDQS